jgi:uncharacterized protein YjbI with pentapeptide repeats
MPTPGFHKGVVFEYRTRAEIGGALLRIDGGKKRIGQRGTEVELRELAKSIIDSDYDKPRTLLRQAHCESLLRSTRRSWNAWRKNNPHIRPMLANATLDTAKNLNGYDFSYTDLCEAKLRGTWLEQANFHQAVLANANLTGAHLKQANFCRTDLFKTILNGADLTRANLQGAQLAETEIIDTTFLGCDLYGAAVWDLVAATGPQPKQPTTTDSKGKRPPVSEKFRVRYRNLAKEQDSLIVDDLQAAGFLYLAMNNANLRNVINAASDKWVLLLGRFSKKGKAVLKAISARLQEFGYIGIIFDFPTPEQKDLIETVLLLAGMSKFVIVDMTSPRSTPLEMLAIASSFGVPVVPIIERGQPPFSMLESLRRFSWVLKPLAYENTGELIQTLEPAVIDPAVANLQTRLGQDEVGGELRYARDYASRRPSKA